MAGACANKAFSSHIGLLHEGEHVWSGFQAMETTHHATRPTDPEVAQTLLDPMGSIELGKRCFPEQKRIGAEVGSPSTV